MLERISSQNQIQQTTRQSKRTSGQDCGFGTVLKQELTKKTQTGGQGVEFSKHAAARAEERGIEITPSLIDQIRGSMVRAQAKGATNILAMDSDKAFIINVPNAKVITAITQDEMKDSVFTNIDGAVFL